MTTPDGAPGPIASDDRADADARPDLTWLGEPDRPLEILARLWATVELDRALAVLGSGDPDAVAEPTIDPLLGARVVVVPPAAVLGGDGVAIALAEPSTEGRLAARLARNDEGAAGWYLRAPLGLADVQARAAAAGVRLSRLELGPFGPSLLVLGGPGDGPTAWVAAGPSILLADPPAVPSRP